MQLDVSKALMQPATPFPFEGQVTLTPVDVNGETITFDVVNLQGNFFAADEQLVRVQGSISTVVHSQCARCMEPASSVLQFDFDELFAKDVDEIEDERFSYDGRDISLDHMTQTLCLLSLPSRFLCKPDCKGSETLQYYSNNNNTKKLSAQEPSEETYRPFEGLESLLRMDEEV